MRWYAGSGFTLVEILIVVIVLSILAAIAIPQITNSSEDAARTAFATDLRGFTKSAVLFMNATGELLPDGASGQVPAGFESYINVDGWTKVTPIGGVWDAEQNDTGGVASALGVHFNGSGPTRGDDYMVGVDRTVCDGDLATGHFRKLAEARYYSILRP